MKKLGLLSFIILIGACGGGGGTVTVNNFGQKALAAVCGLEARCHLFPDEATCEASTTVNDATIISDVNAGKATFNGDLLGKCTSDFSSMSCVDLFKNNPSEQADCNAVFTGTVETDGACNNGVECVSQVCSLPCNSDQCCVGTCNAPPVFVADGDDCSAGPCVAGDGCVTDPTSGAETCEKLKSQGAACTSFDECGAGLYCTATTGAGTCEKPVASGGACDQANGINCDFGLVCDATSSKCISASGAGATCDPNGASVCEFYDTCDASTSKCVALAEVGDSCAGVDCLGSLTCDTTTTTCTLVDQPACP